jgi:hypothetical protein
MGCAVGAALKLEARFEPVAPVEPKSRSGRGTVCVAPHRRVGADGDELAVPHGHRRRHLRLGVESVDSAV